jgi:hypothetical protein
LGHPDARLANFHIAFHCRLPFEIRWRDAVSMAGKPAGVQALKEIAA